MRNVFSIMNRDDSTFEKLYTFGDGKYNQFWIFCSFQDTSTCQPFMNIIVKQLFLRYERSFMYSHKIKVNQEIRIDKNMTYNRRNSVSLHLFEVFVFFSSKVNFRGCLLIANITKEFRNGMNLIVINEDGHFILRGLLGHLKIRTEIQICRQFERRILWMLF